MADASVELRAIFKDEVSSAIKQLEANMNAAKMSPNPEHVGQWDKLKESLSEASQEIPGVSGAMNGLGAAMKVVSNPLVAIPAAFAAATAAGIEFAHANMEATVELVHMSQKTGISVNALAALKKQGEFVGVGIETISMAVGRLNVQLGKNSAGFQKLGIDTKDPVQALAQLADKMKASESASERARIGQQAMGRGYKELLPLLIQGGDAIRKAAESNILSEGMISRYEDMHHSTIQIGQAWSGVKTLIGDIVAGPMSSMLEMAGGIAKKFADAALAWRQMHGQKVDAENTLDVFQGIKNNTSVMNDKGGVISSQGIQNEMMHSLQKQYGDMGIEARKTFLAGFMQLSSEDTNQLQQEFGGKLIAQVGMWQAQINRMPKPKDEGDGELSDKQKAFLEKQAEALQKYQDQNEQSQIVYNSKYAAEADKKVASVEARYKREETALKAHGELLATMEQAKAFEIKAIRDAAVEQEVAAYRKSEAAEDAYIKKSTEEWEKFVSENAHNRLSTDQLKIDSQFIGKKMGSGNIASKNSLESIHDKAAEAQEIEDAKGNATKIDNIRQTYANKELQREAALTDAIKKEAEERQKAQQKYFDAVESGLQNQIVLAEQGKFSLKGLGDTLKSMAQEAIARLISQTVVSLAQSAITGAAWAGPAMLASIASFGAADAAGTAGYESAMMAAQFGGHAKGGFGSGPTWMHESGPEAMNPITPYQVTTASHTTNHNSGGNTYHITLQTNNVADMHRQLRNLETNGGGKSH